VATETVYCDWATKGGGTCVRKAVALIDDRCLCGHHAKQLVADRAEAIYRDGRAAFAVLEASRAY
jgi:hypothetical protein